MGKRIADHELKVYQNAGLFNDEARLQVMDGGIAGITTPNVNMPAGILTQISPYIVNVITRKRTGDIVVGRRMKMLSWEQEDVVIPLIEPLGESQAYSDMGNPPAVSMNPNFIYSGHYRFSVSVVNGALKNAQLAQSRINGEAQNAATALEQLANDFNNIIFNGVPRVPDGSKYSVYGILNDPSLPAYKAAQTTTADATFDKFYSDIVDLINDVIASAAGHVTPDSKMIIALSNKRAKLLSLVNTMGKNIKAVISESYSNLEFILVPEFDGAYTGELDVMYIRAETQEETRIKSGNESTDTMVDSAIVGFSEIALAGAVETYSNYTKQVVSSGTTGVHIFRPYMFARRYFAS